MKKKDLNDLKNKTVPELDKHASDLRGQIAKARMEIAMHRSKNTNSAGNMRRNLASILNAKREKELYVKN